jgi:hypothetical protein
VDMVLTLSPGIDAWRCIFIPPMRKGLGIDLRSDRRTSTSFLLLTYSTNLASLKYKLPC